jgi:uncharacterized damage-inducible protein DinB
MNAKDALKTALNSNHNILTMYLADLSDADLLLRPVPGANHIAWQLGHLIAAESRFQGTLPGGKSVELPAGFAEQHAPDKASSDGPGGFKTKAEYLDLFNRVRQGTLKLVEEMPDSALDTPTTGNMARFAPTIGALIVLIANHEMMHAGQFTVVRRKLGKPVLF